MKMARADFLLYLIIIEKAFLGVLALILSGGVLSLVGREVEAGVLQLATFFNLDADNRFVMLVMDYLTNAKVSTLIGVSVGGFIYSGLNLIEAYGLARRYRWAEYLTVIATGMFIPFEVHKVIEELTPFRLAALVINVLIVIFLARHKELFPKHLSFSRWR
jgi:uncharacterized membrane protein (DUF2068 family)